jgi:hypothetical protein
VRRGRPSVEPFRRLERPLMPAVNWDDMPDEPCGPGSGTAPSARRTYSSAAPIMSMVWRCGRTRMRDDELDLPQGMP